MTLRKGQKLERDDFMDTDQIANSFPFMQTVLTFMSDGGVFMWIIFWMWLFGMGMALERIKSYLRFDINGKKFMSLIKNHIVNNQIEEALGICYRSKALLPEIIKNGLKRANQTKEQIQDAMESITIEVVLRVEKTTLVCGLDVQYCHIAWTIGNDLRTYPVICSCGPGRSQYEGQTSCSRHIKGHEYNGIGYYCLHFTDGHPFLPS